MDSIWDEMEEEHVFPYAAVLMDEFELRIEVRVTGVSQGGTYESFKSS